MPTKPTNQSKPIPFTANEQLLLMDIHNKRNITFPSQTIFKDRTCFKKAIQRLYSRRPSLLKSKKEFLNYDHTSFKIHYSLTFDAKILIKTYFIPAIAKEEGEGDINGSALV